MRSFRKTRILAVLLLVPALECQTPQKDTTLVVKGFPGQTPVLQVNGKSYVEIEALARLTNGTLSFQTNQITLTLAAPVASAAATQTTQTSKLALSKEFLRAAIEELTVIREWRIAVVNAIQNNYPITEDWISGYARNAETKLALAAAAVTKDSDREVLPLLNNEFGNMRKLSDKYLTMHKSLSYISPDSLDNDQLDQQVLNCARGLASLAGSGQVEDVPVCH